MHTQKVLTYDELCKSQNVGYTGDDVVNELQKALGTTNSGPISVPRTSPLMLENMDGLMTEVLLTEKHFKLFNAIPRVPSAGPYFEWNRHKGFGSRRGNVGFAEGGAPKGSISSFERKGIYNKYLGVKGGITHQMLISGNNGGTVEDPQTRENRDRALELFERLEREVVFGSSGVLDESGNAVNFDGLLTQMASLDSSNIIDLQGQALTFDNLDAAARTLVKKGKQISIDGYTSYLSTHVLDGLGQQYKARNIVRLNKEDRTGLDFTPGFVLPGYQTQFGNMTFEHTLMLEEVEDSAPLTASSGTGIGTVAAATSTGATGSTGTLDAGTYYYKVSAFNDTGESLPSVASSGIAVTAGQTVPLVITKPSGNVVGYRVYRATSSAGEYKWIGRVADSGSATTNFSDTGAWRTGTTAAPENGMGVLIKPEPRDLVMSQMAPLLKMPLPQVDTTFPFLLLLYCALVVKAPERVIIFKNCGTFSPQ